MKKMLLIVIMGSLLAGCSAKKIELQQVKRFDVEEKQENDGFYVVKDNESGCRYLLYTSYGSGGITPLLKSDGEPDCN